MICPRCGNKAAYRMHFSEAGQCCDRCGKLGSVTFHDVYFKAPYRDPNLVNPNRPQEKDGVWVESRAHKASLLKEQGLREVGDKVRGARNANMSSIRKNREAGGNPLAF